MEEADNNTIEHRYNSRNLIIGLILLIIFVLILILFLFLIRQPALFGSFAQSEKESSGLATTQPSVITPQSVSFDNSYLFASPLKAAVSVERVRITVYILDGQGMGIKGKQVVLGNSNTSVQVYPISQVTDDSGRATFDITSNQSGLFTLEASVDGKKLTQKVTVSFN